MFPAHILPLLAVFLLLPPAAFAQNPPADLHQTAEKGDVAAVRALLARGALPNVPDRKGATPLMLAAGRGYSEVVELLLKHGADPNRRDRDGDTALKYAAWNDDVFVVEALIAGGADMNLASELNITPLRVAATSGNTTVVEALLRRGANPNIRGRDGKNALSFAIGRDYHEIERLLRDAGGVE